MEMSNNEVEMTDASDAPSPPPPRSAHGPAPPSADDFDPAAALAALDIHDPASAPITRPYIVPRVNQSLGWLVHNLGADTQPPNMSLRAIFYLVRILLGPGNHSVDIWCETTIHLTDSLERAMEALDSQFEVFMDGDGGQLSMGAEQYLLTKKILDGELPKLVQLKYELINEIGYYGSASEISSEEFESMLRGAYDTLVDLGLQDASGPAFYVR